MIIKFTPRFNGPIQGRSVNIIKKFYPYLCAEHEFDDLMQEAYLVFMHCKELYGPDKGKGVDKPQWFMTLYSRALTNKLINLGKKCGRYISIDDLDFDTSEFKNDVQHPRNNYNNKYNRQKVLEESSTDYDTGYAYRLIQELPEEVRQLMAAVISGAVADGRLAFAAIQRKHKTS